MVKSTPSTTGLKPGDKVDVPWGVDHLIGTVREVYGPPAKPFVMVEVPVHGASGEILETTTLSFPADALTLASAP
jgi:rRNA processing protein Gar1